MSQAWTVSALQDQLDGPPFHRWLGLRAVSVDSDAGEVTIRLPFRKEFQRQEGIAQIHGGVTSALVDIAGDYAIWSHLGHGVPTIDLRVDYLRMAEGTDLIATAKAMKIGRSIGVVDILVADEKGRIVAVGRGTYSTRRG